MSTITAQQIDTPTDDLHLDVDLDFGYCDHYRFAGSLDFGPPEICGEPAGPDGLCDAHAEPDGDPDLAYELDRDERI